MPEQSYHHKNLKAQLIAQGLKLLDTEGYAGFSLRKAAKLCGVSQTAPYRHFQSKDDLIRAIAEQALDEFAASLRAAVAQYPGQPQAQLEEMGVAYIRFFVENPEYLRLFFLSDVRLRVRLFANDQEKRHNETYGILQSVIDRCAGEAAAADSRDRMLLYSWGLVHGIAALMVSGEVKNDERTLALAEQIVRGHTSLLGEKRSMQEKT
ncbi:MAG TPA: TetR/AcrR family transcriptional regulator [Candidatus Limiplasma sp.]|nr:TetR/AcrR family transcriptional regulator [Candidatus Limiplasma sp.]